MKHSAVLTAVVAAAVLVAVPAAAQTLTGTWEISSETQRGPQNQTLTLTQDGETLTGTVSFTFGGRRGGGGGGGPQSFEITEGKVDGNAFSFTMLLEFDGGSVTLSYSGTVDGDTMEGTRAVTGGGRGGGQPTPFTGTRGG